MSTCVACQRGHCALHRFKTGPTLVSVTMDKKTREVPSRVTSWTAIRKALGVPDGHGVALRTCLPVDRGDVAYEAHRMVGGWAVLGVRGEEASRWWNFHEGDVYRSINMDKYQPPEEDKLDPWQRPPDAWRTGL